MFNNSVISNNIDTCVYIYIYIYMYTHIYTYIHIIHKLHTGNQHLGNHRDFWCVIFCLGLGTIMYNYVYMYMYMYSNHNHIHILRVIVITIIILGIRILTMIITITLITSPRRPGTRWRASSARSWEPQLPPPPPLQSPLYKIFWGLH